MHLDALPPPLKGSLSPTFPLSKPSEHRVPLRILSTYLHGRRKDLGSSSNNLGSWNVLLRWDIGICGVERSVLSYFLSSMSPLLFCNVLDSLYVPAPLGDFDCYYPQCSFEL